MPGWPAREKGKRREWIGADLKEAVLLHEPRAGDLCSASQGLEILRSEPSDLLVAVHEPQAQVGAKVEG